MRKTMLTLALSFVVALACASDAFAQRRGGIGYGGGGYRGGSGISIGRGGIGFYGPGYGYGNGYYGSGYGYGNGYYGSGYGSSYYGGSPYYSSYAQPYYGSNYYSSPIVQSPGVIYQSSYEPVQSQQSATVVVLVPRPDAMVWFNGAATTQQGVERSFATPPLDASSSSYSYTIRARWTENGQTVERERRVNVQPGQSTIVDFRGDAGVK